MILLSTSPGFSRVFQRRFYFDSYSFGNQSPFFVRSTFVAASDEHSIHGMVMDLRRFLKLAFIKLVHTMNKQLWLAHQLYF